MLAAIYWTLFTIAGIWGQSLIPGVDFFAPGLAVSLRWQKPLPTVALALIWVALQEGSGGLSFGYALLWYVTLFGLLSVGRWLFDPGSAQFHCLVGLALGVTHFLLLYFLATLELRSFPLMRVLFESLLQAMIYPGLWFLADRLFPERLKVNEEPA